MSVVLAALLLAAPPVVLVEDRRAPEVELRVEVPVGRWSPWFRKEAGEAAWEALLLDPDRALLRRADALGVDLETSVGSRACTLRAAFLREDLTAVTELLADVLKSHEIDRGELERNARARALGWRLSLKDPAYVRDRAAVFLLFPEGDPRRLAYLRPSKDVPGEKALRGMQERMLALPGRLVGIAGDVDPRTAEELARRLLPPEDAAAPAGAAPALLPPIPVSERKSLDETVRGLTQVYLADVRTSVPLTDADAPAFAIADHVLGGHFYSRLYTALRHEGGETYGAGTSTARESVEMMYSASTATRTDNASVAERKLKQTLATLHRDGITEEERTAALGYLRGRLPFTRQEPAQILDRALFERRLGLAPGSLDALVDRAEATSLAEVNAFIRRFYDPSLFRRVRVR